MGMRDSRIEYSRRMHRVVEFIDRHLDENLDLATLAEVAHFSPFHFHRLFTAWMGETLGDYLRRRRLEVAATRLTAQPGVPVLQIALGVGFGSSEAFAHAFRARFGVSATTWRREQKSKHDQIDRKWDQDASDASGEDGTPPQREEMHMDVKLIDRPPVRIVYLSYVGPYGKSLSVFWTARVMPWIVGHGALRRAKYGIAHDNPNVTAPEKCRCDVGFEVDEGFTPTGDEHIATIPGGRYATTPFYGTVDQIHEPWTGILRDWLPDSGMQLDARPMFEYYPPDMKHDDATGAFECEVTIPVAPL
jgi:AraC family transcriptional regulator